MWPSRVEHDNIDMYNMCLNHHLQFLDGSELLGHFTKLTGLGISTKLPYTVLYIVHLFTWLGEARFL